MAKKGEKDVMTRAERVKALERQLDALGTEEFEFAVLDRMMARRIYSRYEALDSFRWMASRNFHGSHIYLRPTGTACVLVDDVDGGKISQMVRDGLEPAAAVLTSPANYQVWLRFPEPLGGPLATAMAQMLATRYEADMASAAVRHLGRAVGFRNRKQKHRNAEGEYPWVRLSMDGGKFTGRAEQLVDEARTYLVRKADLRRRVRRKVEAARAVGNRGTRRAVSMFSREIAAAKHRFGDTLDRSRADALAARKMANKGWSREEVMAAILSMPSTQERKWGHVEDYAARTVRYAFGDGDGDGDEEETADE